MLEFSLGLCHTCALVGRFAYCWELYGSGVFWDVCAVFCFYLFSKFGWFGCLCSGSFCCADMVGAGSLFFFLLPLLSGLLFYLKFLFLGLLLSSCLPEVDYTPLLTPP